MSRKKKKPSQPQSGKNRWPDQKYFGITNTAAAKSLQSCPTLQPHRRQPTRLPWPWDSPGKNTWSGLSFPSPMHERESESEVVQSCPTLSDPMDRSLQGSCVNGIFQVRVLEWVATAFSRITNKVSGNRNKLRTTEFPSLSAQLLTNCF